MASERYSERVQKITREGGAGSMEKPKIAFDVDGVLGDFCISIPGITKRFTRTVGLISG